MYTTKGWAMATEFGRIYSEYKLFFHISFISEWLFRSGESPALQCG